MSGKKMRFCPLIILLLSALFLFNAQADQNFFVTGFEDIPLAPKLQNDADTLAVFDTLSGRIIESQTKFSGRLSRIFRFYKETLPELGWQPVKLEKNIAVFTRDGEKLTIDYIGKKRIRFLLSPPSDS